MKKGNEIIQGNGSNYPVNSTLITREMGPFGDVRFQVPRFEIQPFKGRGVKFGDIAEVYRNLNRKGTWYSIVQHGRVVAHGFGFALRNAKMVVSEAGRQRVIKEKKKNVHAKCVGIIHQPTLHRTEDKLIYNPYKYDSFVNEEGEKILAAEWVFFEETGVYYFHAENHLA